EAVPADRGCFQCPVRGARVPDLRTLLEPLCLALRREIAAAGGGGGADRCGEAELHGAEKLRAVPGRCGWHPRLPPRNEASVGNALVRSPGTPDREPGPARILLCA